jgi:hypothetical protein
MCVCVCVCGVCVCSLRYPACNVHAPYCHLWPALLYKIFPHYLINGMIKKQTNKQNVYYEVFFNFCLKYFFHSRKNWVRYDKKMYTGLHVKFPLFLSDFNETWTFWTGFLEILKYEIFLFFSQWELSSSMLRDGWMDRHEGANSHFSRFCEHASNVLLEANPKKITDFENQTHGIQKNLHFRNLNYPISTKWCITNIWNFYYDKNILCKLTNCYFKIWFFCDM